MSLSTDCEKTAPSGQDVSTWVCARISGPSSTVRALHKGAWLRERRGVTNLVLALLPKTCPCLGLHLARERGKRCHLLAKPSAYGWPLPSGDIFLEATHPEGMPFSEIIRGHYISHH